MLKAQRAAYILARLQELYPQTPVPLDHTDPFTLLVAVLLSAQCTDERVNQVTPPSSPWLTTRWTWRRLPQSRSGVSSAPVACHRKSQKR